ncbi:RHS repeat-associated core domain-containing protein [Mucilaginibacter mallensis]|uniref:RHS repeat-associated core domain-containing protein n=1 Tax=Mucilaginibacter mallensis TaxID=652787 RepID=A0A1H1WPW7_MUCMA|nr:RHS repeat-associated core domain-containing protein [Mucilaginibacter mallensis]SDS99358.1 RHS repeat-associated core domain-containing protein [Mucilaginibacter mallensis]
MSNSNSSDGVSQQSVPQITTFQFSNDAVGQIKDSVNLFTGTANIPINIASLPGRKDLDINIGIMYNSNVQSDVKNWNLSNPTGIIGLGWEMTYDKIVVNKNGSGTPTSNDYYLLSNGSGNQLVQDGFTPATPANILLFQLRNYEFWDVKYDQYTEKWTVIKEDGTVFIYGDKNSGRNTLQYGVGWGNWLGDSSTVIGQEQYVVAWNLSEMQNVWGEKITYSYNNVQVKVGDNTGMEYTQASYLKQIIDSFNRTITYNYGEKYGAKNPGTQNIVEYQAAHTQKPAPNSYQEQYETRYLDHIDVQNPIGDLQFTILFEYDFINLGVSSQTTVYPLMWKRVLTSFWQVQPDGRSLPGMEFEYYDKNADINSGALKTIIYPQGARATYNYKQQALNTSRNLKLNSPLTGATPRVWFGSDYTVITWYNATTKTLRGTVYSWCGNWITFDLNSDQPAGHYFDNVDFDIDTLGVITRQDFIALYFTEKTKKQVQLFLYRRNPTNFGVFNLSDGPRYLPVKTATPNVSVQAGKDFVIAFSKDFTTNAVTAYQWNWKQKRWDTSPSNNPGTGFIPVLLPSPGDVAKASNIVISANDNYYIAALYNQTSMLLQFQLFYHDGNNTWNNSVLYNTSNVKIYQDPNNTSEFPFSLSLSNPFAVATYVTAITATEADYTLRILQWDKSFNLLNPGTPLVNNYKSPVSSGQSQFSVFNTILSDSLITNNPYLNRYTGGPGNSNNPQNWKQASFVTKPTDKPSFVTGQDISIMSLSQGTAAVNQYYQFNPDTGMWGIVQNLGSAGTNPTIGGNYITAGKDIFYQNTNGQWIKQQQQLNSLQAPETVQNRGASYIAYQDNTTANAQTYFASPLNGIPGNPQPLPVIAGGTGQKIMVQQDVVKAGTLLAGSDTFVTYPSNQDFNTTLSLALFKVVSGKAADTLQVTPVAYIEIDNAYNPTDNYYQSYDYASSVQSVITYDAQSNLAQFPKVTVVTGSKTPNAGTAPAGVSINYFSNGVSVQSEIPYPSNWIYNFNQLLNGSLLQKLQYNKQGQLVTSETNYWQVFQNNIVKKNYFFGAFYRLSKSVVMQDGVTQTTGITYFQDLGLQQFSTTSYCDSSGETKTILTEKNYAIQVDAYNIAMTSKHLLNAVAQDSVSVTGKDGVKRYTSSKAVTWKNWANDGSWKWAAYQNYQWLGPANGNPLFDFTDGAQRSGWLKKQEVISRGLPYSVITEMANVDGVVSSYIYDTQGRFEVAEFPAASKAGDEASYYSFEPYEIADGWQLGTGASIIPNTNDTTIDAQMGISSLKIGTGTGIQRQFIPKNQQQDYVFSSYVKLPNGFDANKGNANWRISFIQNSAPVGNDIILPFGNIVGSWQYVYCIISLQGINSGVNTPITINIKAQNDNTTSAVLIDCLRFSPLQSLFAAISMNMKSNMVDAALGANGEIRRKFFDSFQQLVATTGFSGETTSIATNYFSRTGNDNQFSTSDPNSKIKVLSAGGGPALPFTKGNEWMQYWAAGNGSVWNTDSGMLKLSSFQTTGTLSYIGAMTNNYGVLTNVLPSEAITQPLGIKVGNMFTLQWQPATGQWELLNASGAVLQQKKVYQFIIDTPLDDTTTLVSSIQPYLLRRGVSVSNDEMLSLTKTDTGIYDAHYQQYFALQNNGTGTEVSGIGTQWSLLVNENSLLFFVDGELVFNYINAITITGAATLFAGNKIALDYLLTSFNNQITFTCINEAGNDLQSQLLDNTQLTVIENVYDNLGRIIANTKPAFVTADQAPLFQYITNFATYNSSNGIMTGLVADYYPADGGYPYFGTRYETSPLGRQVELSMSGTDYKMGTHTETIAYGTNDNSLGLPAGEYFRTTITDQNGNVSYSLADKRGLEVRKLSQKSVSEQIISSVYYDDAGNATELRSPNYQENDPDNANWITYYGYNFIGQLISSTSNTSGTVNMIYDQANRLRFRQDAEAVAQDNYQYFKYDIPGRIIESGYLTGVWNSEQLQQQANSNPAYPDTPVTWRTQTFYDNNGTSQPFQIGRVIKTLNNQSDNGSPDVEENFVYDVYGNVTIRSQQVFAFDSNKYITGFTYNNLGGITQIDYPTQNIGSPLSIFYQYNSIGQLTGVGKQTNQPDGLAAYIYNAAGKPVQEILNQYGNAPIKRAYSYNSPVWLKELQDNNSQNNEIFDETLKTSATNGPSYYNGQSAEIAYRYPQGISSGSVYTNYYNGINALEQVNETSAFAPAINRQYGFDNNGNFNNVSIGSGSYQYNGQSGKGNQLQSVTDKGNNQSLFSFIYNQNGAISSYIASGGDGLPAQNLGFIYDPGNRMTTLVEDNLNSKSYKFYYSSSNDRVLKQVLTGTTVNASTMYISSLAGNTLVQLDAQGSAKQLTCIVYGPIGIIGFIKDDKQYNTLKDHLGSIRVILDDTAAVAAAYDYDLYGNLNILQQRETNFFSYLYSSQEFDFELGIYNYKARFYFSRVGRFGVVDNYNQFYSPYIFAGNSPLIYVDPSGNFSIGNFFSAIGGAIIGAFEILIGVAVDAIAGILEVVTGGLSTPASIGLASLGGAFLGSGISAVSYSAVGLITNDFSWKDYGVNTAIGFVAGAITAGFGAAGSIAAEAATGVKAAEEAGQAVSSLAKAANSGIKAGFAIAGGEAAAATSTLIDNSANGRSLTTGLGDSLLTGVLSSSLSYALPSLDYKAGWGNLFARMVTNIAKSEAIGLTVQLGTNAVQGDNLSKGLLNTVVGGLVDGSIGNLGTREYASERTKSELNFMGLKNSPNAAPADGIIRL